MLTKLKNGRGSELEMPEIFVWLSCDVFRVGFSLDPFYGLLVCGGVCGFLWFLTGLMNRTAYKHHGDHARSL